ncbi:kinase [Dokdonella soli]|uniref:kinase n=1 Tax=Dokdonella soli TaxID=529810 RepID=UPI0036D321B6
MVDATLDTALGWLRARPRTAAPLLVGLSGLQGSGKSTFARQLAAAARRCGTPTEVLSLDDFYLGRRARMRLARDVHPLLATRGVPGTHDLALLTHTVADLAHANVRRPVPVPRFDKGRDTRLPPSRWRGVTTPPRLILLEGWCVGVPPQPGNRLASPLNALERNEDTDGRWRRWVNAQLADAYADLWRRFDRLILLEAPGFAVVTRWRDEQERALRARHAPQAMGTAALQRFLMHYERLSRHALRTLPACADLRLVLRRDRSVRTIVCAT